MPQPIPSPVPPPDEAPAPATSPVSSPETVFLELTADNLRRIAHTIQLVPRPGAEFIQEFRSRLIPGAPRRVSVTITSHRIVFGDKTYALANITSVSKGQEGQECRLRAPPHRPECSAAHGACLRRSLQHFFSSAS